MEVLIKKYTYSGDDGELNKLIDYAISNIIKPRLGDRQIALEKLWDAFERIKTYYEKNDKKKSVAELIEKASEGFPDFNDLINAEMTYLTKVGNRYRIRHHETDKIEISSSHHIDYLFYRMMSMISLLIKYI